MSEQTEAFFDAATTRPWNSHYIKSPQWHRTFPTMLTQEELRMLTWVTQMSPHPGDVADLGCFLGGSTMALCTGLSNAKKMSKVYSYDRFRVDEKAKFKFLYKKGYGFYSGEDSLPLFEKLTAEHSNAIVACPGDILQQDWPGGRIGVLFIDLSKTKSLNDHIVRTFFPRLDEGSILVQQDFLFFRNPWLFPTMYFLRDAMDFLSYTEDHSVIFGVRRKISDQEIHDCMSKNISAEATIAAIEHFREKFPYLRQREMVDALLAAVKAAPKADKAWELPNAHGIPVVAE